MSPVEDLTLSLGGFRVPARVRLFLQSLAGGLVGCFAEELGFSCDCAVPGREDTVLLGGVPVWGFLQEFQWISEVGDQSLPVGGFLRSCGTVSAIFIWHLR